MCNLGKIEPRTYEDLLVAINSSTSNKGFRRLLSAEERASRALAHEGDELAKQSYKDSVTRLVRWVDEPFPANLAAKVIWNRVREREEAAALAKSAAKAADKTGSNPS